MYNSSNKVNWLCFYINEFVEDTRVSKGKGNQVQYVIYQSSWFYMTRTLISVEMITYCCLLYASNGVNFTGAHEEGRIPS